MVYWDNNAAFHTAITEGEAIGMEKGETRANIEIARNMKTDGVDPKVIAKYSGLSPDEIERLH